MRCPRQTDASCGATSRAAASPAGSRSPGDPSTLAVDSGFSRRPPRRTAASWPTRSRQTTQTTGWGPGAPASGLSRSEEHTSELQSHSDLVCRLLLEKKKKYHKTLTYEQYQD